MLLSTTTNEAPKTTTTPSVKNHWRVGKQQRSLLPAFLIALRDFARRAQENTSSFGQAKLLDPFCRASHAQQASTTSTCSDFTVDSFISIFIFEISSKVEAECMKTLKGCPLKSLCQRNSYMQRPSRCCLPRSNFTPSVSILCFLSYTPSSCASAPRFFGCSTLIGLFPTMHELGHTSDLEPGC